MQRLLAVLLVLIGLSGLALGRLGETTWAPATETTATVDLADAGPAVVIDPGVLYVGGEEGEVVIEGASDVSVITASNSDIEAYLEGVHHTRVTGASDWTTLSTEEVDADGADEIADPTVSDLWRSVETAPSPHTIDVAEFWAAENGANEQVYRSLLIVTDGTAAGAEKISITWPVEAENEWVPFAYAGGAAIAVIGLVLLVVSLGGRRRDEDEDDLVEVAPRHGVETAAAPLAEGSAAGGAALASSFDDGAADDRPSGDGVAEEHSSEDDGSHESTSADREGGVDLFGPAATAPREENVWSLSSDSSDADADAETGASSDAEDSADSADSTGPEESADSAGPADSTGSAGPADGPAPSQTSAAADRTEQIDAVDDGEGQR